MAQSQTTPAPVPFLDLAAQDREIGADLRAAVQEVMASRQFVLGPATVRFEAAVAEYTGVRHAIGVGSGTDALLLGLQALGVGPGTRVLTTAFSFFATASTIARLGAQPVFADIDPATFNLDPASVEAVLAALDVPVAGIMPVHLFGRLADMDALGRIARRHGLWLLEDAAQAIGARRAGRMAGGIGQAGCLSFYPTKNLGGAGDGGMLLTDDDALARRVREDRHHGQTAPYVHERLGMCSRLDGLQAAVLQVKLGHLDRWNALRRAVSRRYRAGLEAAGLTGREGAPVIVPPDDGDAHVHHVCTIRVRDRDRLIAHLTAQGIATQVYYRVPLHQQAPLRPTAVVPLPLVETERAAAEVVALPIFPELRDDQVDRVVEAIAGFYAG